MLFLPGMTFIALTQLPCRAASRHISHVTRIGRAREKENPMFGPFIVAAALLRKRLYWIHGMNPDW
ncbi:hypothetical protein A0U89_02100 [Kozakia baliensis]|uniref:Uncharacterized protein n=1 Tax=Kozakia baliensis TaxID=153496 RepID=A0A1D8UR53_9PROT|nr:hypothetical protein A0U89_02100 [Kozakia baliensis]